MATKSTRPRKCVWCDKSVSLPSKQFCVDHTCVVDGCATDSVRGKTRCRFHKCGVATCDNYTDSTDEACVEHMCGVDGCKNIKINQIGCGSHICFCGELKKYRYGGCATHNCGFAECRQLKTAAYDSCPAHKCIVANCRHQQFVKNSICQNHVCECGEIAFTQIDGLLLCWFHSKRCRHIGCDKRATTNLCSKHYCRVANCPNEGDGKLCAFHSTKYDLKNITKLVEFFPGKLQLGMRCERRNCRCVAMRGYDTCMDHYWLPKCLYCLSDDECSQNCTHHNFCQLPCYSGLCRDPLYVYTKTQKNYTVLSRAKFLAKMIPTLIELLVVVIAEYFEFANLNG